MQLKGPNGQGVASGIEIGRLAAFQICLTSVLCDTNRYRRNIGIEIENFRYFRYRIGIGIERGVIRGIGIGIGIVRRVSEVLVLVSVL